MRPVLSSKTPGLLIEAILSWMKSAPLVGTVEGVTLSPRVNGLGTTSKLQTERINSQFNQIAQVGTYDSSATADTDCDGNVCELNVVENNGALEVTAGRAAAEDECGSVRDNRVDDGLSPNTLSTCIRGTALS